MSRRATTSLVIQAGFMAVPTKVYTAVKDPKKETARHNMHAGGCESLLKQPNYCEKCERIVPKEEIMKVAEVEKGRYVQVSDEEMKNLHVTTKYEISIERFVPAISPIYFAKSYDLMPDKGGSRAFNLLLAGLAKSGKMAIGRVTLTNREQLACLRVEAGVLMLTVLHYGSDINSPLGQALPAVDDTELELFNLLIERMSAPFDPTEQVDTFKEKFLELVAQKRDNPKATLVTPQANKTAATIDLTEALRRSLDRVAGPSPTKAAALAKAEQSAVKSTKSRRKHAAAK